MAFKKAKSPKTKDTRDSLVSWREAWDEEEFLEERKERTLEQHSGFFFGVHYETKGQLAEAILKRGSSSLSAWRAKWG